MRLCTRSSLDELEEKAHPVTSYQFVSKCNRLEEGECPFCKKLDVFRLDSKTGELYCEDCEFKGDSLLLFMTVFRMSFQEAVEKLAAIFDVELEWYEMSKKSKEKLDKMQRDRFPKPQQEEENGS